MNYPRYREQLSRRFSGDYGADVTNDGRAGLPSMIPQGGSRLFLNGDQRLRDGYHIALAEPANGTWLELKVPKYVDTSALNLDTVELNIIQPSLIRMGRSALLDTVRLTGGDHFIVGRNKYNGLSESVSRRHLSVDVLPASSFDVGTKNEPVVDVLVTDLYSSFGTYVYSMRPEPRRRYQNSRFSTDNIPETEIPTETESNDPVQALHDKYFSKYPTLGIADYAFCLAGVNDIKNRAGGNEKIIKRSVHKIFHPDMNRSLKPEVASAVYLLAQELLGIR